MVSPPAGYMWQPTDIMQKKGHVSLQNILPVQRRKKEETWEREEDKVFLHQRTTCSKPSAQPRKKPQQQSELSDNRITTAPQMTRLSLAQYLNQYESTSSLSPSSGCFCTSDLYQHLSPLLNSWHQRVVRKIASYILFETRYKYDTPPKLSTTTWFISNHQILNGNYNY